MSTRNLMMHTQVEDFVLTSLSKAAHWKSEIRACCPYHTEDTPSFFLFPGDDEFYWFKCFGCGKAGSLYGLVKHLGGTFLLHLIKKPAYDPEKSRKKEESNGDSYRVDGTVGWPALYDYYNSRGIPDQICRRFRFRHDLYAHRAVMPIYTGRRYKGYIARNLDPGLPRYYIESGINLRQAVWAYDELDFKQPTIITEGQIDGATWWTVGYQAVALLGKNWQTKLDLLKRLEKPICVPDNEATSLDTFHELARVLCGQLVYVPHQFKDTNEAFLKGVHLPGLLYDF